MSGSRSACRYCRTAASAGFAGVRSARYQTVSTHLVVDRERLQATLYRSRRTHLQRARRDRRARSPTPQGEFTVRSKLTRYASPVLRAGRVRHDRTLSSADRLAGRRLRRNPRDKRTRDSSRPCLARLHPSSKPRHPASRRADAGRDAGHDPMSSTRSLPAATPVRRLLHGTRARYIAPRDQRARHPDAAEAEPADRALEGVPTPTGA